MDIRVVAYDHPDAAKLIAEVQQEYVVRYGDPDVTPVDPADFGRVARSRPRRLRRRRAHRLRCLARARRAGAGIPAGRRRVEANVRHGFR
jgi:hypothetical protein